MIVSIHKMVSITEANQNFTKVAKQASKFGDAVIFKHNKPAYVLFDIEKTARLCDGLNNLNS